MQPLVRDNQQEAGGASTVATSDKEFDVWFRDNVPELHGMDVSNPPPLPEPAIDVRSRR